MVTGHGWFLRMGFTLPLLLMFVINLAGCIDPDYLAEAKDRYETRYHLKKDTGRVQAGAASAGEQKRSHPPYRNRECNKCHDQARGGQLLAQQADLCYLCHDPAKFARERLHGPVAVGKCSVCHVSHENANPYHTTSPLPKLCLDCHTFAWGTKGGLKEGFHVHKPVHEGGYASCHDPHGGTRRFFLQAEPSELCLRCHDPQVYRAGVVHGPLAVGDCLVCHDPHAAKTGRLLKGPVPAELCFKCHTQLRVRCPAPPGNQDCLGCHHPHRLDEGRTGGTAPGVAE